MPDSSSSAGSGSSASRGTCAASLRERKRLLIVDGYNVLRSGSRYRDIDIPDYTDDYFNVARERLLKDVADFAGRKMEAVIAYDAAGRQGVSSRTETYGKVKVVFSSRGQSADSLIEKLAYDAGKRGIETLVVTSDATIQDTVFGGGVDRMSAEGFCLELESESVSRKEDREQAISHKRTVADRIPADTLEKLRALRDGK